MRIRVPEQSPHPCLLKRRAALRLQHVDRLRPIIDSVIAARSPAFMLKRCARTDLELMDNSRSMSFQDSDNARPWPSSGVVMMPIRKP